MPGSHPCETRRLRGAMQGSHLARASSTEGPTWGIDGTTQVADMNAKDGPRIWEPYAVKVQTRKDGDQSGVAHPARRRRRCAGHQGPEVNFADPRRGKSVLVLSRVDGVILAAVIFDDMVATIKHKREGAT